jgi:hypothetical protein
MPFLFLLQFCLVTCTIEDAFSIHANLHVVITQKQLGYQRVVCIHKNIFDETFWLEAEHVSFLFITTPVTPYIVFFRINQLVGLRNAIREVHIAFGSFFETLFAVFG